MAFVPLLRVFCILKVFLPSIIWWGTDITDWISVSLKHCDCKVSKLWVVSMAILHFSNQVETGEKDNPTNEEIQKLQAVFKG